MSKSTIINYNALSNLTDESLSDLYISGIIDERDVTAIKEIIMARNLKRMKDLVLGVHRNKISEPNEKSSRPRYKTRIMCFDEATGQMVQKQLQKTNEYDFYEALCKHYNLCDKERTRKAETLESLYRDWIEFKKLHTNAPTYIARIQSDWKRYYVGTKIIKKEIRSLTKLDMDEWVHGIIKQYSMTKTTYYNASVIMRQMMEYAVDKGIIQTNPFSKVKVDGRIMFRKSKKKRSEEEVFSKSETRQIYELAKRDYLMNDKLVYKLAPLAIMFQFQTGLRVGELCGVKFSDIEGDYIHIQRMVRNYPFEVVEKTKTDDGDRMVYLTSTAKEIILEARNRTTSEFIFSINDKPLKPSAVQKRYTSYCDELGILHRSSHKARKTYNSLLLGAGVNIDTVRRMMGHADEHTTLANYTFDVEEQNIRELHIESALSE